jgi:uncharacterized membrane protein YqiK
MDNITQIYFDTYFTEIIVVILVLSIGIVIFSIFYVVFNSSDKEVIKKKISMNKKKIESMKYTKQFLKGVDGIDLDLKVNHKKKS